jgi:hypothetical protein
MYALPLLTVLIDIKPDRDPFTAWRLPNRWIKDMIHHIPFHGWHGEDQISMALALWIGTAAKRENP